MTHSIIYYQAWVRWLLCNNIIPKAIPLSERLAQCPHLAGHINTMKLVELARTYQLWYTQDCSSHMGDGCMGWHWQLLMTAPWHSLPHHPSTKPTLFHSLSALIHKDMNVFTCQELSVEGLFTASDTQIIVLRGKRHEFRREMEEYLSYFSLLPSFLYTDQLHKRKPAFDANAEPSF